MFEKIISKNPEDSNQSRQAPSSAPSAPSSPAARESAPSSSSPASAPASKAPVGGQRNILSNDVSIVGSVRFTNDLLVDGKIDGEISSEGSLTVAENAIIKAEIKTKSVVIYGKVHGNIVAADRIEIKDGAEMIGDVKAATLSIEPGAIFVGKSEVGTPSVQPQKTNAPGPQGNVKKGEEQKAGAA